MAYEKDINTILNELYTAHRNKSGNDPGLLSRIKYSAMAVVFWGAYKFLGWISRQMFADTCDSEALIARGSERGIGILSGEGIEAYRLRVLANLRQPAAGGNPQDYEQWALESSMAMSRYDLEASMLTSADFGSFVADNAAGSGSLTAWTTTALGSTMVMDFGESVNLVMLLIKYAAAGCTSIFNVQYSDDSIVWLTASSAFSPDSVGFNKAEWVSVGVHRYWRLLSMSAASYTPAAQKIEAYNVGEESVVSALCVPWGQGPGTVDVVISSDLSGEVPSNGMAIKCTEYLGLKAPAESFFVRAVAVYPFRINITIEAVGDNADRESAANEITALLNGKKPGQPLYLDELTAIVMSNGADHAIIHEPTSTFYVDVPTELRAANVTIS